MQPVAIREPGADMAALGGFTYSHELRMRSRWWIGVPAGRRELAAGMSPACPDPAGSFPEAISSGEPASDNRLSRLVDAGPLQIIFSHAGAWASIMQEGRWFVHAHYVCTSWLRTMNSSHKAP